MSEGLLNLRQEARWRRISTYVLIAFFALSGIALFTWQRIETLRERDEEARIRDPEADDPGVTATVREENAAAEIVEAGIYVERITDLSIKEGTWRSVFDVWFRWKGDSKSPAEQLVLVGGDIDSRERLAEHHEGDRHYERYRLAVTIYKSFSLTRFPLDQQLLIVALENGEATRSGLVFAPDVEGSSISSRVFIHGYDLLSTKLIEKPHSYKTGRGDPRLNPNSKSTFSQLRFVITIQRSGWGIFMKMFTALYVSVAIAFLACFIKPTNLDPRFGLGVGALFTSVANSYVISSYVPETGSLTLADILNCLGIVTILVTLVESTFSLYLYEKWNEKTLAIRIDMMAFRIMSLGFLIVNLAAILAGRF